nr:putative domain, di-copper centre, polyphenol oxidase [Tanacetum cinerariifolium]
MSSTLVPLTSTFTSFPSKQLATSTNSQFISKTRTNQTLHGFKVSCNASPEDNENQLILPETQKLLLPNNVDRRNLLVGLGGLYTAASIASLPSALASPIMAPDITSICQEAKTGFKEDGAVRTGKCCPPSLGKTIQPFVFPSNEKTRVRWPAHKGSEQQVRSYKKAIKAIRDLPDDHPHSFVSQAKIHCAYCNGGYTQVASGFPEIEIQIHNSWLFFPFHRWYLYFYERILRKYSGDDDFALPYWNWDNPEGMTIPQIFVDEKDDDPLFGNKNPLYDVYREARHLPPKVVDLFFSGNKEFAKDELESDRQRACNLSMVYKDLIRNATDWKGFFGGEYTAGNMTGTPSVGSVESNSHTAVHVWVGDSSQTNGEDMGNFYSAGYDPVFYVHHANVDRMWKLWKDLGIPGHSEPTADDWLNASYVFYDENENLVRVYNKDSVNIDKLKYDFAESKTLWKNSRPAQRKEKSKELSKALIGETKTVEEAFKKPASVVPVLKVRVKRPTKNRTPEEKAKANEILCINGIQFNSNKFVKFDVFVNDKVDINGTLPTACDPEFAGSFAQVPHSDNQQGGMLMPSAARFGLNELLDDTKTEDEEYALVALVARAGCEDLTVSGIEIKLVPIGST